jgi:putative PEP-CTERM system TPR-repeat lipoprotein
MRPFSFKAAPLVLALSFTFPLILGGCDSSGNLSADEHIERAKTFQSQGDLKAGILELKNAVQKDPENKQARWLLGMAYLDLRLGGDAEAQLTKSVQLGISPASARIPIARAQLLQADYQKILDTLLPGDNDDKGIQAQILDLRANALLGLKQFSEGCALFNRAIEIDDSYGPAHTGRARCQYGDGLTSAALTSAERATQLDPTHLESWYLLGDLRRALNQNDAAIAAYDQALKIKPNDYDAIAFKAMTLLSMDRMKDAEASIKRLNAMRPHAHPTKYLKAYVAYQQGRNSEATNLLQQILKDSPDNPQANMLFGTINYAINNNETALSSFNRVLSVAEQPEARLMLAATQVRMNANADADKTLAPLVAQGTNPKALLLAGQVALNLSNLDRGMAMLARANALSPKDTVIRTTLAQNQILSGNTQGIRGLESVITDKPDDSQAYLLLAASQFSRGELVDARATLQKMAVALPKNPMPFLLEGRIYLKQNNSSLARQAFERSLSVDPTFLPAADELAALDIRDNKPEQARQRFQKILANAPDNLGALMGQARVARLLKDQKGQVAALQQAIKSHPKAIEPATQLVHFYLTQDKQPTQALDVARKAASANNGNPAFFDLLGQAQLGAGQAKDAVDTFTSVTNRAPQSAGAWYQLAWAQRAAGDLNSAVSALQKASRIAPDNIEIRTGLAGIYILLGQQDNALQTARELQTLQPKSAAGFNMEAELAARFNKPELALKALEQAYRTITVPDTAATYHLALVRAKKTDLANTVAQQWLNAHPKDTAFRIYLAGLKLGANDPQGAITIYRQVLQVDPDHILALNNLAALLLEQNDASAPTLAMRAYKLQPDNPIVIDTYAWVLVQQGKATEALPLLQRAAKAAPKLTSIQFHLATALARTGKQNDARVLLNNLLSAQASFPERAQASALLKTLPKPQR